MRKIESDDYFEVELMLGTLDETHIIRTIEYWDIERQRRPASQHYAVIVAEQITSRFFNVIRLIQRIPIIAVKLSAFKLDDGTVVLHPVTVLSAILEDPDEHVVDNAEKASRPYWEKKSSFTLSMVDQFCQLIREIPSVPRETSNRGHIAVGTSGRNFCWFFRRKTGGRCYITIQPYEDERDGIVAKLREAQIEASPRTRDIGFGLTKPELDANHALIKDIMRATELSSR